MQKTAILRGGPFDGDEVEIWVKKDRIVRKEIIQTGWSHIPTKAIFHCYKLGETRKDGRIEYKHCPEESH